jgi:hypothetical protein
MLPRGNDLKRRGRPAFAFPVAYAGKKPAAPSFAVFERWESMLRAVCGLVVPSATLVWRCLAYPQGLKPGPLVRVFLARVNSCPSRAWRAFGFVVLFGLLTATSAAEAGFPSLSFCGTSELVPFPSLAGLWVRGSVWAAHGYLSG